MRHLAAHFQYAVRSRMLFGANQRLQVNKSHGIKLPIEQKSLC
jgi:hypothetical protein